MTLSGKSGGAVVCFLSLLKEEHQDFRFLLEQGEQMHDSEEKHCLVNLYNYVNHFCHRLVPYIDTAALEERLSRIVIVTTKVTTCMGCIPSNLQMEHHTPTSIEHMIDLVCASCYVPVLSRTNCNPCCYTLDDEWAIDGAFLDMFYEEVHPETDMIIHNDNHSKFSIPTKHECILMYYEGLFKEIKVGPGVVRPNSLMRVQTEPAGFDMI